jgi:hypothetical protein
LVNSLPTVIAGPILRHTDCHRIVWWLITSAPIKIRPMLLNAQNEPLDLERAVFNQETFCVGQKAFIQLVTISSEQSNSHEQVRSHEQVKNTALINEGELYQYDLLSEFDSASVSQSDRNEPSNYKDTKPKPDIAGDKNDVQSILKDIPGLCYDGYKRPNFRFNSLLHKVTHGSCRKPHFNGTDALPQLDNLVADELSNTGKENRPDMMLMTGDQVYVDDVAGPMLKAIHQLINLLGLHNESFEGATIGDLTELMTHENSFYHRELLLPIAEANDQLSKAFFAGKRKPVFTSVNAKNHLIALSEMLAMYMLSWSPTLWQFISAEKPDLNEENNLLYDKEYEYIEAFRKGLPQVQRALAHVPSYMIFDDHDVTDDWNLTRGWEQQVYGHPFSKRIIGNALAAYFLCQGCGNPRIKVENLFTEFLAVFSVSKFTDIANDNITNGKALLSDTSHLKLIDMLFDFDQWHYELNTQPPVHVLDTRTQRWRSESSLNKPSGLMDWEALCELQQSIMGKESVIMVSAAPVYGVKFIETIQKIFTIFGGALVVDAENWMAHRGTASVMLNIFRHIKTPPKFIILSGDVHYSFVYDVGLRFRRNSPHITQFTSSGLHNEFPEGLLRWFDRLNSLFYGYRSPLNWLTKRRNMTVRQRQPSHQKGTLVNHCNIGVMTLSDNASKVDCALLCSDGSYVNFLKSPKQIEAEAKVRAKAEQN